MYFCKANTKWQIQKSANLPGESALKEIYQDVTKCLHIVPSRLFCNKNINRSGIYDFCSIWPNAANLIAIPGKFFKKLKCRSGRNGVSGCIMAKAASSAKAAVGNSSVCVECNSPLIHPPINSLSSSPLLDPVLICWIQSLHVGSSPYMFVLSATPLLYTHSTTPCPPHHCS